MLAGIRRAVVIEDEEALAQAIARIVSAWGAEVSTAASAAEAKRMLAKPPPPDLILIDVRLPDDSAFGVLEVAAQLSPRPLTVAMSGKASPDEAFRLAQQGVHAYLAKPFSIESLAETVARARVDPPALDPLIAAQVGRVSMLELQSELRRVMLREALARSEGSRTGAARLLRVTRQAVQQMLRRGTRPDDAGDRPRSS
jgi:DNA-binding NtrC family response regulator